MPASLNGQIILAVNGLPYIYLSSLSWDCETNREVAIGMNPLGTPVGWTEGTKEYSLDVDAFVPKGVDLAWESITNAIIVVTPRDGGLPDIFTGVFVKTIGTQYSDKGLAKRKLKMVALNRVGL